VLVRRVLIAAVLLVAVLALAPGVLPLRRRG